MKTSVRIATLLGALMAMYFGWQWALQQLTQSEPEEALVMQLDAPCEPLLQSCQWRNEEVVLTMAFPTGVDSLSSHMAYVTIDAANVPITQMQWVLQGKTMYMGVNHFPLLRSQGNVANLWQASLLIPICTTDIMTWQLTLWLHDAQQRWHTATFEFDMTRD